MSTNYDGLTRNTWPGTWSPNGTHPVALDTELRGTLQSISGLAGDKLTDILGQRLTEGMLVYVKTTYIAGAYTRTGDRYYKYTLQSGEFRNSSTGGAPNAEANWSEFSVSGNLPIGGTAAQVLTKSSATDYAAAWTTLFSGGLTSIQVVSALPGSPNSTTLYIVTGP